MECPVCHNQMEIKHIKHVQEWQEHYVLFENVPALVCSVCREVLFSPKDVDRMNELLWALPKAVKKAKLDVYQFT